MPTARKELINLETTPYYHCYARCVRKGYLFGTGENDKNYDHRKSWVLERLQYLCQGFAIDVCAYAIMSNHYHVVFHVNKEKALAWSDEEVNIRWKWVLGRKTPFSSSLPEEIHQRRENLYSISWFMSCINEHIARLANKEDNVKGRFWESRFKSQALTDEGALLACMVYVDLNPIRAKMTNTLENSDFTSIQERLHAHHQNQPTPSTLMDFQPKEIKADALKVCLPFAIKDYLLLIDWTGRQFREDKPGFIPANVPPLVREVGLNPSNWVKTVEKSSIQDQQILGALSKMKSWAQSIKKTWLKGQTITLLKYLPT
jgi:REP element-mobilizing transposase RayT